MKKLILPILFLVGCTTAPVDVPKSTIHPNWPAPVKEFHTEWKVIDVDGKPFVALPYEDSQYFRIWGEEVKRYILQSNNMICYYRKDLNEPRCQK